MLRRSCFKCPKNIKKRLSRSERGSGGYETPTSKELGSTKSIDVDEFTEKFADFFRSDVGISNEHTGIEWRASVTVSTPNQKSAISVSDIMGKVEEGTPTIDVALYEARCPGRARKG
jgi:hypothetical protein